MKATSREDVIRYEYVDNVLVRTETLKSRSIYRNKAGVERIHWVRGYRQITRENGLPVWHHYCKTCQALNIFKALGIPEKTHGF